MMRWIIFVYTLVAAISLVNAQEEICEGVYYEEFMQTCENAPGVFGTLYQPRYCNTPEPNNCFPTPNLCPGACLQITPESDCTPSCFCYPGATRKCTVNGCPDGIQVCQADRRWGSCTPTDKCRDDDCKNETDTCCDQEEQGSNSVNVTTGEVTYTPLLPDAEVRLEAGPLALLRDYSSHRAFRDALREAGGDSDPAVRSWGAGWYHQYEHVLFRETAGTMTYFRPGGKLERFTQQPDTSFAPLYHPLELTLLADGVSVELRLLDGTLLLFRLSGPAPAEGRLESVTEPSGRLLELTYYEPATTPACELSDTADPRFGRLCTIVAMDPGALQPLAGIHFADYGRTACTVDPECTTCTGQGCDLGGPRLLELRYGPGDDPAAYTRSTRYTYDVIPRINQAGTVLAEDLTTRLLSINHLIDANTTPTVVDGEIYEYTHDSYLRPDLGTDPAFNPYASSSTIRTGLGSEDLQEKSVELLWRIRFFDGNLREGYEYDAAGRGAASLSQGELLRFEYQPTGAASENVIVTNESSGTVITYGLTNNRIDTVSDDCGCGGLSSAEYERDANGRVIATRAIDPDPADTAPGTRTALTRDAQWRIVVELENWEGAPVEPQDLGATVDPLAGPTRVSRFEHGGSSVSLPSVESRVFSAVCPEAGTFGLTCPGTVGEPLLERLFDPSGTRVETERRIGLTLDPDAAVVSETLATVTAYVPGTDRVESVTDPAGQVESFVYFDTGAEPDPCGSPAGAGNLGRVREVRWNGTVVEQRGGYDDQGRLGCSIDENGVRTSFVYDHAGRVLEERIGSSPDQRVRTFEYRPDGSLTRSTFGEVEILTGYDPPLPANACQIDDAASLTQCLDDLASLGLPANQVLRTGPGGSAVEVDRQEIAYDRVGRWKTLDTRKGAGGSLLRRRGLAHDAFGRLERLDKYGDDPTTVLGSKHMQHDALGRIVAIQDEGWSQPNRTIQYDALGRVSTTTTGAGTPDAAATTYGYDAHDNLATVTDPDGRVTRYLYDDFGRLVVVRSPDSGDTRYAYDAVGNLVRETEAAGSPDAVVTVREYDDRHRVVREYHDVDPQNLPAQADREYVHDTPLATVSGACPPRGTVEFSQEHTAGRLSSVGHGAGITYYSYTPFGEIAAQYEQDGPTFDLCSLRITRFGYDDSGRVISLSYPSGREIRYLHVAGKLGPERITLTEPGVPGERVVADGLTYDEGRTLAGFTAGSVELQATRDLASQLVRRSYHGPQGHLLDWHVREREKDGTIRELRDGATGQQLEATYDGQARVSTASGTLMRGYQDCAFDYDDSGNRLSETCLGKPLSLSYEAGSNGLDELAWDTVDLAQCATDPGVVVTTARPIERDAQGRLTTHYSERFPVDGVVDRVGLTYGSFGRLAGVDTNGDGTADHSYVYDHRGLRLRKDGPTGPVRFGYDPRGRLIAEETGSETRELVRLDGVPLALLVDPSPGVGGAAQLYVLGTDHLGRPLRAWSHANGDGVWAADHEVFGDAHVYRPGTNAAPAIEINLRFPGQYLDAESGLHYNWNRYYDPHTGRYVTEEPLATDPLRAPQQVHEAAIQSYAYATGSPLMNVDPQALASEDTNCSVVRAYTCQERCRKSCTPARCRRKRFCKTECVLGCTWAEMRRCWGPDSPPGDIPNYAMGVRG